MVFTTYQFLFWFLPIVLLLYYAMQSLGFWRGRTLVLTLASWVFYGWQIPGFLVLIWSSTLLDYFCGRIAGRVDHPWRKKALWASVVGNLSLLFYFKYSNFGMESLNGIMAVLGHDAFEWTKVALPIGISFYTFQTMSYTIDVYRGDARPARNFLDLACYVAMFPQLIAGPIVRYRDLDEQLRERRHSVDRIGHGTQIFMCGFAKKILIADSAALFADIAFTTEGPGLLTSWVGVFAYTIQIYYDFSGYSDMAIGLGRMFGFEFPINFRSPYRAKSVTDFWRRWHVSLSSWLRDYLYVPLGGNRRGLPRTYANLMITMLLGGLWHGAQWTFVFWGVYHGCLLALERMRGGRALWSFLPSPCQNIVNLLVIMVGWTFFRARDLDEGMGVLRGMVGLNASENGWQEVGLIEKPFLWMTVAGFLLTWLGIQSDRLCGDQPIAWVCLRSIFLVLVFMVAVSHMFFQEYSPFLYFQF